MIRRLPIVPTLIVLAAVAIMVRLGFWQLERLHQKEAQLARYAAAASDGAEVPWPSTQVARDAAAYHRSRIDCRPSGQPSALSGRSARGEAGWAHAVNCTLPDGASAEVVLGWSRDPQPRAWAGGAVTGTIGFGAGESVRLIADPPLAGLEANALPDPSAVPNNHLSYAVQWFLFALTALAIYALALRKRLAATGQGG